METHRRQINSNQLEISISCYSLSICISNNNLLFSSLQGIVMEELTGSSGNALYRARLNEPASLIYVVNSIPLMHPRYVSPHVSSLARYCSKETNTASHSPQLCDYTYSVLLKNGTQSKYISEKRVHVKEKKRGGGNRTQ